MAIAGATLPDIRFFPSLLSTPDPGRAVRKKKVHRFDGAIALFRAGEYEVDQQERDRNAGSARPRAPTVQGSAKPCRG